MACLLLRQRIPPPPPFSIFFSHHVIPSAGLINFQARALRWEVMRGGSIPLCCPRPFTFLWPFLPMHQEKLNLLLTVKQRSMSFITTNMYFCSQHKRPQKIIPKCFGCPLVRGCRKALNVMASLKKALTTSDGKLQHIDPFCMSTGKIQAQLSLHTKRNPSGKVFASKDLRVWGDTVV